jgi:hypothetical protein
MMYDDRYQRRQMRRMRRANRRYYRGTLGGLSGGIFLIGLAIAFALSNSIGGYLFLPIFFAGMAFCALLGSASSFNARGLYGGLQGFTWLMGLAFCFLFGFWPWILVVTGVSCILGALYVPLTSGLMGAGIFAAMQSNQQQYPQYQPPTPPYPQGQEPGQSYQQGYQPQQPPPGSYVEGEQQYQYPQQAQPKQEYDQPQSQYPPQEMPLQQ